MPYNMQSHVLINRILRLKNNFPSNDVENELIWKFKMFFFINPGCMISYGLILDIFLFK